MQPAVNSISAAAAVAAATSAGLAERVASVGSMSGAVSYFYISLQSNFPL